VAEHVHKVPNNRHRISQRDNEIEKRNAEYRLELAEFGIVAIDALPDLRPDAGDFRSLYWFLGIEQQMRSGLLRARGDSVELTLPQQGNLRIVQANPVLAKRNQARVIRPISTMPARTPNCTYGHAQTA
jgi:hypothetical protein